MYVVFFISGNTHLKAEICGTFVFQRKFPLSASGGVVPRDYMNSTWDAVVQKTLGAEKRWDTCSLKEKKSNRNLPNEVKEKTG